MNKITYKKIQLFLVMLTFFMLYASFYFQYFLGMHPCPLCLMQRICIFMLLVLFGLSLGTIRKAHLICALHTLVAAAGLFFASRQLWLQHLPAGKAPACMPSLEMLIRFFPWKTVAHAFFWGSGDCAEVSWGLWGIPMPGWAALYFLFMTLVGIYLFIRTRSLFS